jgi:hypothetical protein
MKGIGMLRKDILLGYIGLALALILSGLFAPPEKTVLGIACLVIGVVMVIIPIFVVAVVARRSIKIFSNEEETFSFVKKELQAVCERGGRVFSTYVLEEPTGQPDLISQALASAKKPIQYGRLILIDDPKTELEWLADFLKLNNNSSGLVSVSAYVVSNQGRLISRFIRRAIPYINIFLVKYDSPLHQPLFFLTLPKRSTESVQNLAKFAIAVKNRTVTDSAWQYFENLLTSAGPLIRQFRSVEQYKAWRIVPLTSPKTMSIIEIVREIAENNHEIVHVGVFGSVASRLARTFVDKFSKDYENDLDLLIVVADRQDKDHIKNIVKSSIERLHPDVLIEWSNESSEFYWIRRQYQIDVQIHVQNDSYYADHPLLGWSVFSNYYVLYSELGKPLNEVIGVPTRLLNEYERSNICLKDDKFGVLRFLSECKKGSSNIDPRRVISINARNYAWVIAGTRPQTTSQALSLISEHMKDKSLESIQQIQRQSTDAITLKQRDDLCAVTEYLQLISNHLKEKCHG